MNIVSVRHFLLALIRRRVEAGQDDTGALKEACSLLEREIAGEKITEAEWDCVCVRAEARHPQKGVDFALAATEAAIWSLFDFDRERATQSLCSAAHHAASAAAWDGDDDGCTAAADERERNEFLAQVGDLTRLLMTDEDTQERYPVYLRPSTLRSGVGSREPQEDGSHEVVRVEQGHPDAWVEARVTERAATGRTCVAVEVIAVGPAARIVFEAWMPR